MKNKKKLIIIICIVAVVAVAVLLMGRNARLKAQEAQAAVQTRALSTMTLADTVSVTGRVESTNSVNVYSPVATLAVKTVNVEVGDMVKAGDLLCELNTDNLQKDIDQSQAAIEASESSTSQTVKSNEMKYNNAVGNLNNGLNAQVNSAKASFESAQANQARTNEQYYAALDAKNQAKAVLDQKQADYNTALAADPSGQAPATIEAQNAMTAAQIAYDQAAQTESQLASATYDAQKAVENARLALEAAQTAANQEIEAYKQAVNSSETAANTDSQEIALEKLQMQLDQSKITSPIDGTVTAVNAVEGGPSSGVLFVVESTDGLQISTTVKEYDVNRVKTGMTANIQSDGTGEDVYEGKLRSIAPAAVVQTSAISGTGTVQAGSSSDVEFDAVVDVTSQDTGLKIGMNARVDIVLDQKDNVLAVPYDAVVENTAGEKVVYAQVQGEQGSVTYQEIPVITGMETDFYIEVSGKDLKEGMLIVTNPDAIPFLNNRALPSASASAS